MYRGATQRRWGRSRSGWNASCRSQTLAPELEQIVNRPLDRNGRGPSQLVAKTRRIAVNDRQIVWSIARRVDHDANRHVGALQHQVEQVAHFDDPARTDV